MIFVLRQIQEKCRERNMGLYAAFVDLTEDFDTVSRDGLWEVPIPNGVKQGCVLAPTLFFIFFSIMLREAIDDLPGGIYIRF